MTNLMTYSYSLSQFCRSKFQVGSQIITWMGTISILVSVLHCFGFNDGNLVEIFLSIGLPSGPQIISSGQQLTEPSHKAEFSHCHE